MRVTRSKVNKRACTLKTPTQVPGNNESELELGGLGGNDVLFGRGHLAVAFEGNRRFRMKVWRVKDSYLAACRSERGSYASRVIEEVQREGGRFLELVSGQYEIVGSKRVHEKVCQALRCAFTGTFTGIVESGCLS